jgi:hypothetical protein
LPGAELRHYTINQKTNKEASETLDYWKSKGVNISDKICKLIIQERRREIQAEQYGGVTPTEAFLGITENEKKEEESLLALLPPTCRKHSKAINDLYQQEEYGAGGSKKLDLWKNHPLVMHLRRTMPYQYCSDCIRWCEKVQEQREQEFREQCEKEKREQYESDPIHFGTHEPQAEEELKTRGVDHMIMRYELFAENENCFKCRSRHDQLKEHFRKYRERLQERERLEQQRRKEEVLTTKREQEKKSKN